jgi:outer membrane protein OmpA-like peptidoglycan-associated protein
MPRRRESVPSDGARGHPAPEEKTLHRRSALAVAVPLSMLALAGCRSRAEGRDARARQRALPVVFFTDDSAAMGPEARAVVAGAAERARAQPGVPVSVRGFTAPEGNQSPAFSRALAEARAQNVADALVAGGVPRDRIRVQPRGPVPFEMMPVESRRVEIHLGG